MSHVVDSRGEHYAVRPLTFGTFTARANSEDAQPQIAPAGGAVQVGTEMSVAFEATGLIDGMAVKGTSATTGYRPRTGEDQTRRFERCPPSLTMRWRYSRLPVAVIGVSKVFFCFRSHPLSHSFSRFSVSLSSRVSLFSLFSSLFSSSSLRSLCCVFFCSLWSFFSERRGCSVHITCGGSYATSASTSDFQTRKLLLIVSLTMRHSASGPVAIRQPASERRGRTGRLDGRHPRGWLDGDGIGRTTERGRRNPRCRYKVFRRLPASFVRVAAWPQTRSDIRTTPPLKRRVFLSGLLSPDRYPVNSGQVVRKG
jgi:hypothetical protein